VRPALGLALVPFDDPAAALSFTRRLRDASRATWRDCSPRGIDAVAIEHMDARSLAVLREDGADRLNGVVIPQHARAALLVTLEFPASMDSATSFDDIGRALDADAPDTPLVRFCRMLESGGALERVQMAVPGDTTRAEQLIALREAVPAGVNQRVRRAKEYDSRVEKMAADVVVPFERVVELLQICDEAFRRRGLDGAVWGHISDGNLHPNVIPGSMADVDAGKTAILEMGRAAIHLGGAPLAEHGVGRNRVKQQLLRELYGEEGIEEMRRVKRAIDPDWKLAPGVLFPRART
jgi:D-lactate dehydrogenase (cytochrome)